MFKYSLEEKQKAVALAIKYDGKLARVITELGYPDRVTLYRWMKDYRLLGEVKERGAYFYLSYNAPCPDEKMHTAVKYYLEHGKNLSKTMRDLGYPKALETLCRWIDKLAPGERQKGGVNNSGKWAKESTKLQAVAELTSDKKISEVATSFSASCASLYYWRDHLLKDAIISQNNERGAISDTRRKAQESRRRARYQRGTAQER